MPMSEAHNLRQVKIHLAAVQKLIDSAHEHGSSAATGALQRTGLADVSLFSAGRLRHPADIFEPRERCSRLSTFSKVMLPRWSVVITTRRSFVNSWTR